MSHVERLKAEGRFFHAGSLAASLGYDRNYGCHYGMRSTLNAAKEEFYSGYDQATYDMLFS